MRHSGADSSELLVTSGVLQGCVPKPSQFVLYGNPLESILIVPVELIVADFKIALNITRIGRQAAQKKVDKVATWSRANKIDFTIKKSICQHRIDTDKHSHTCGASMQQEVSLMH